MAAPIQFRFSDATLSQIEELKSLLGLASRAEVVRYAVRRLLEAERKRAAKTQKSP